ncbi:hypothetical protein OS493_022179 [Desmophyllum pertusum]|uniref:Uncharacterized protein n=1 Tax=Desmophyllum pertusum TaxID=174260 RepID=A0A9W9YCF3_9CNID|nr:hypothetical protein OS493_022179 [Desmophyllum pertusum]
MAAMFARDRVAQICFDANYKPTTGDISQLSPLMKSVVQPSSKPYPTQSATDTTAMAPLTNSQPISGIGSSTGNASGGVYQSPVRPGISPAYPPAYPSSVPQNTFLTPGPSTHPYPHSTHCRLVYPLLGEKLILQSVRGASPLPGPFAPKTAAELGLLDRPDTSYEGMEMSNIVDRMSSAFPLDVHSDMPVDIHNDIFLAASLIGEAMQSMVTTVSRQTGARKGALESGRILKRDTGEPGNYDQDNPVYGDWPREVPGASGRFTNHSTVDGYEYGPL